MTIVCTLAEQRDLIIMGNHSAALTMTMIMMVEIVQHAMGGGWWFAGCYHSLLTGKHATENTWDGIHWTNGTTTGTVSHVEMKI